MANTILDGYKNSVSTLIKVKILRGNSSKKDFSFNNSFTIGRNEECSIRLNEAGVSKFHVEVIFENSKWWIVDRGSSNGTYINGNKIQRVEIKNSTSVELGTNGPILLFTPEDSALPPELPKIQDASVTGYIRRYFDKEINDQQVGEHTKMIRAAFNVVQKKHTSKYVKIIIGLITISVLVAIYAIYQGVKENKQKLLAESIFYDMKSLELRIANFKKQLSNVTDPEVVKALEDFDREHRQLGKNYEKLVDELGIYNLNEEDKLIVKTARIFGECEFAIPPNFISEVKNYIKRWQSTPRLQQAIERANQRGFTSIIKSYMIRNQLPKQFFYLALQESDFIEQRVGPPTRYGYAKGMWQFISPTAQKYGLAIGPLAEQNVYDPGDDRFNFPKATSAAARYIKDIYNTDAQASGLLVIGSYNWGEHNIISLIRSLPENPRERNFWKVLEKYKDKIPPETYNYVFYIFSAAVICENPGLFGFNFENPLGAD